MRSSRLRRRSLAAALIGATVALCGQAGARRNGIVAEGCEGCHSSAAATVELSASPATFAPGEEVTFSVTLRRASGSLATGGIYIEPPVSGELRALSGEGLTRVPGDGFTHAQPKAAQAGSVSFRFAWRAPATPGGVTFDVYGVASNGDNRSGGDAAGTARFQATFGCAPERLFYDSDDDGFGSPDFDTVVGCVGAPPPERFSPRGTDCNENDAEIHPDAVEKCNRKDDDCDGQIDENADPVELWPDDDGDGYYGPKTGTPMVGCTDLRGYAAEPGDCAPRDANVHRGATETCNLIDDNCDGRVDERTRPQCGVGFCRAESFTCVPSDCVPSLPVAERCNLLDDDCDGETDEGELCASGQACLAGQCVTLGDPADSGGTGPSGGGAGQRAGAPAQGGNSGVTAAGGSGSGADTGGSCALGRPNGPGVGLAFVCLLLAWRGRAGRRGRTGLPERAP